VTLASCSAVLLFLDHMQIWNHSASRFWTTSKLVNI